MQATLEDKRADRKAPLTGEACDGLAQSDARAVNSAEHRSLYQKREQIYPKDVQGLYRTLKWAALVVLLAFYYAAPLLRWNRPGAAPDQFVLVDFPGRRMYFGPIEIWPQEVYYITGLLILAAVGLFLATALFGRIWCGYACPQTVWTDLYIAVERFFEGDRNARIKRDKGPNSFDKIWRKSAKHAVWVLIALATGGWFVAYFHDAPTLFRGFFTGEAPGSAYLFAGILTLTTYSLAGVLREQVCTYMCPWPRIQAALIDDEALQVTYRFDRGEERGPHKKGQSWDGRGDCIDCRQCVAACPMGIDIRDGAQLECINCGLCIDACDAIMARVDRPKRLIAYDTDKNIARRQAGGTASFRFVRARTIVYAVLFVAVGAVMLGGLLTRSTLDLNTLRDRNPLFVRLSDGSIRNAYTVKILNKQPQERTFDVTIEGVAGARLEAVGVPVTNNVARIEADPDRVRTTRVFLIAPKDSLSRDASIPVRVRVRASDGEEKTDHTVFITRN